MIIMLAGRRKAGKTCFADIVTTLTGMQRVAFADILKETYSTTYDVALYNLHDPSKKEEHRAAMLRMADEIRVTDKYYFCRNLFNALDDNMDYVIDDPRTIEELEVGLKLGAIPFKVHAEVNIRKARGWVYNPEVDEHYTETEMDLSRETFNKLGGDIIYNNTMNMDTLKKEAYIFVNKFLS